MYKYLLSLILIFSFISCKNDKNTIVPATGNKLYSLKKGEDFNMVFAKNIPVFNIGYPINFNSDKYSFSYPGPNESYLYSYVFDKKQWEYKILPYEGQNGIIKNGFFKLFENDTLLYFPYGADIILVINYNTSKIIHKFDFVEGYTLPFPKRYNCGLYNNNIYFPTHPFINSVKDFNKFGKYKLMTNINLITGEKKQIIKVPGDFYDYHAMNLFDMSPEFVFPNDSTIVFIMRKSPNLYVYDIKTDKTKAYYYPDEHIKYTHEDVRLAGDNIDYMWTKGFYRHLYYDNKNKIYYRISIHVPTHNADGTANVPVRVTAFDDKFNLLAEEDFEGLIPTYSFVNTKGLYILKKGSKENQISFQHIILEKNTE